MSPRSVLWSLLCCVSMVFASCHHPVPTTQAPSADPELASVDSLMWQQPDSALTRLIPWFDTEPATEYDRHYAHLLLAELLYKNDYEQTNRKELRLSVDYFDSLADGRDASATMVFLDARAHYMNGVGYYERDSVVEACGQYLKAVEIMENGFPTKHVMQFIALTFTRLSEVFSSQYLHEQAIYYAKQSLLYYSRYNAESWHISKMLEEIGSDYEMLNMLDSAELYYQKALACLNDTNSLTYRDIEALCALLDYSNKKDADYIIKQLDELLFLSASRKEYCIRCMSIGGVYYYEQQFDSAWKYLNIVFEETENTSSKKQAAEWLAEICKHRDLNPEKYLSFLLPFSNQGEIQSGVKSLLLELYSSHIQRKIEERHQGEVKLQIRKTLVIGCIICMILICVAIYFKEGYSKKLLDKHLLKERRDHQEKQKAMGRKLKESEEALRVLKHENHKLTENFNTYNNQTAWSGYDDFMKEDICKAVLESLKGKPIKRALTINTYSHLQLSDQQLLQLEHAVERHFKGFRNMLTMLYPKISRIEMYQCYLCLLNLKDTQIAVLLNNDYSTIYKRSGKLQKAFSTEKKLQNFIKEHVS